MSFSEGWGRGAWSEGPYNEPAPDVTVTPTAVTSTFATGTITHQGDALVSLSGLSSSTSLGTVSIALGATVTPSSQLITAQTNGAVFNETVEVTGLDISAGHQGWSRGEWNEGGWGIGIPGIEIGETSLSLGLTVTPTGVSSTVTEGNFSVTGTSNHNPVGAHAQVFLNNGEAQAGATVAVTGIEMDFVDGGADATGDAIVTPTGVLATSRVTDVDIVGSVVFSVTGVSSTFTTGTLDQASIYSVTGIELDFDAGDETISGNANVDVTGIEILAVSGNMRSTPWANVQTDANNSFTAVNTGATNEWTEVAA